MRRRGRRGRRRCRLRQVGDRPLARPAGDARPHHGVRRQCRRQPGEPGDPRRRDRRPDRPERLRQDHAVQLPVQGLRAGRRRHRVRRAKPAGAAARYGLAARHRPHLPDSAAVRRSDRAGKRRDAADVPRRTSPRPAGGAGRGGAVCRLCGAARQARRARRPPDLAAAQGGRIRPRARLPAAAAAGRRGGVRPHTRRGAALRRAHPRGARHAMASR